MKVKDLINELEKYDPEIEIDNWGNDLPEEFVRKVETRRFHERKYEYRSLIYHTMLEWELLISYISEIKNSPTYLAKHATYDEFVKSVRIGDDYTYCISEEDDSLDKRLDHVLYLTEKKRELAIR